MLCEAWLYHHVLTTASAVSTRLTQTGAITALDKGAVRTGRKCCTPGQAYSGYSSISLLKRGASRGPVACFGVPRLRRPLSLCRESLGRGASASQGPALVPGLPLQSWMESKQGSGSPRTCCWRRWGCWGAGGQLGSGASWAGRCGLLLFVREKPASAAAAAGTGAPSGAGNGLGG